MFDTKIKKHKFHYHKNLILIEDVDINKIIVSDKLFLVNRVLNILLAVKIMKVKSLNMLIWANSLITNKILRSFSVTLSSNHLQTIYQ